MPSIGQNFQRFTGNCDISISVKILGWDQKPQSNKERGGIILILFYIEFVAVTFNVNSDQASLSLGTMSQVSNMSHGPLIYFG